MANKLVKRRPNNLLTARRNLYTGGSWLQPPAVTQSQLDSWKTMQPDVDLNGNPIVHKASNYIAPQDINWMTGTKGPTPSDATLPTVTQNKGMSNTAKGIAGQAAAAGGGILNPLISNGRSTKVGNAITGLGNTVGGALMNVNPLVGGIIMGASDIIGGVVNNLWGASRNEEKIAEIDGQIDSALGFRSGARDYASLAKEQEGMNEVASFEKDDLGSEGIFSNEITNLYHDMSTKATNANQFLNSSFDMANYNIGQDRMRNIYGNITAHGGPLWSVHGADFTNGLTVINNGGTHEQNPYEGVLMGVDQEGVPNLVEEGEVIFNDYVFSNRLKVPKSIRNKYKLGKIKTLSFADAALKMGKESEERPNDPISQRGLQALLGDLAYAQEEIRAKKQAREQAVNYAAEGGRVNKFVDGGDPSNYGRNSKSDAPYNRQDVWSSLVGKQLIARLEQLAAMPEGAAKQQAIRQFYEQANSIQDSYFEDIYNSGVNWAGPIKVGGKAHQELWNTAGWNGWSDDDFSTYYKSKKRSKDEANTWVDNKIGDVTLNRNLGHSKYISQADRDYITQLSNQLGLNWDVRDKGNDLLYFSPMDAAAAPTTPAQRQALTRYWLTNRKDASGKPIDDERLPDDYDSSKGAHKYLETRTSATDDTDYTDIFFEDIPNKNRRIYVENTLGQKDWGDGYTPEDYAKAGLDPKNYRVIRDDDGNEYHYLLEPQQQMPNFDNWLRYAPVLGAAVGLGTSLFSKPDESHADAILEAARTAGQYQPIGFKPVGNYLTYRPLDVEFAANKANAESAATRRALLNSAGANRAQAMSGILAADNNALNQLGILRRGAAEDNRKQEQLVEEFNRATNMFNSEGFFKADSANQSALANQRQLYLSGVMQAEALRQNARQARENAINLNLSNLFTSLGNIGSENVARQQFGWAIDKGLAPGHTKTKAKGGKLKRIKRRGLTY